MEGDAERQKVIEGYLKNTKTSRLQRKMNRINRINEKH